MINLTSLGWNDFYNSAFSNYSNEGFQFGRITIENKTNYLIQTEYGEVIGEVSGRFLFAVEKQSEMPKVGDWVVISLFNDNTQAVIHNLLPRRTKLSRKSADRKIDEQIIAANVDVVFIVQSLDSNFNINRLERYLAAVNQSKAKPVIVLNKSDLCDDLDEKLSSVKNRIDAADIVAVSAVNKNGINELSKFISEGITIAFIGSSGVGKSTLINLLLGRETLKTNVVRLTDSKGKHTTTKRELIVLPSGGILIDTPGMREFGLWNAEEGLAQTFSEFDEYAGYCKYSDCTHTHEAGCAVLNAVEVGKISKERYEHYLKLLKELKYLESKQNISAQLEEKRKWKTIHKEMKNFHKKNKN